MYKKPNTGYLTHHWHPHWDEQRAVSQAELTQIAAERLTDMFYQRQDMGVYGLGKVRSLEDYAKFSGIDYINRTIHHGYREPGTYSDLVR
jgi:hypothetical protein